MVLAVWNNHGAKKSREPMSSRKRPNGKRKEGGRIKSLKNSLIIHKERTKEISIKWVSLYLIKTSLKFTSDIFCRPLAHCAVSLKCWFIRLRVFAYESLKIKKKSSWVIPKVVAVAYERFSLLSLNQRSNSFHKGGRNLSWSLTRVIVRRTLTVLHCFLSVLNS